MVALPVLTLTVCLVDMPIKHHLIAAPGDDFYEVMTNEGSTSEGEREGSDIHHRSLALLI